jgi:hypothetical protein
MTQSAERTVAAIAALLAVLGQGLVDWSVDDAAPRTAPERGANVVDAAAEVDLHGP